MHQFPCVRDHCAECGADGLMTQADAEDGDFLSQGGYDFCDNAGFFRSSGAGRENDLIGRQPGDFLYRHLIIADHPDIGFNFSDELVEIIGKTVIIGAEYEPLSVDVNLSNT